MRRGNIVVVFVAATALAAVLFSGAKTSGTSHIRAPTLKVGSAHTPIWPP